MKYIYHSSQAYPDACWRDKREITGTLFPSCLICKITETNHCQLCNSSWFVKLFLFGFAWFACLVLTVKYWGYTLPGSSSGFTRGFLYTFLSRWDASVSCVGTMHRKETLRVHPLFLTSRHMLDISLWGGGGEGKGCRMAHGPLVCCHGVLDQVKKYLFSKIVLFYGLLQCTL